MLGKCGPNLWLWFFTYTQNFWRFLIPLVQEQTCVHQLPLDRISCGLYFFWRILDIGTQRRSPLPLWLCSHSSYNESNFFVFTCGKKYNLRKKYKHYFKASWACTNQFCWLMTPKCAVLGWSSPITVQVQLWRQMRSRIPGICLSTLAQDASLCQNNALNKDVSGPTKEFVLRKGYHRMMW